MAASEGDEVLVGLFGGAEPLAQMRYRAFFEGDHRGHIAVENTPGAVNFLSVPPQ